MQSSQPLLTIAIPTYNRRRYLEELLLCLQPQLVKQPRVELVISDNASDDDTEQMVEVFQKQGLILRYTRNSTNIGPDANFARCFEIATGKYFWILGDDDLLTPLAIDQLLSLLEEGERTGDFDLVYLSSFGFTGDYRLPSEAERKDRLGRFAEIVTEGDYFLGKINALIGLVSANILNRDRWLERARPPIRELENTFLPQVGLFFPLLHTRCRVLYVWERLLAYRSFNSGGWGICEVFGLSMHRIASRYFVSEPNLTRALMNGVLRYWMCDTIIKMRLGKEANMKQENFIRTLQPVFRTNWRYWVFIYPVAVFPLRVAKVIYYFLRVVNKSTRIAQGVIRHLLYHGKYLRPETLEIDVFCNDKVTVESDL
jgi:abequosyltransferase